MWFLVAFFMVVAVLIGLFDFFNRTSKIEKFANIDLSKFPAYTETAENFKAIGEESGKETEKFVTEVEKEEMKGIAQKYLEEKVLLAGVNRQDLKLENIEMKNGVWQLNYRQYYKDILVEKSHISIAVDDSTKMATSLVVDLYSGIELNVTPKITLEKALEVVKREAKIENITVNSSSLVVYSITEEQTTTHYLAWKLNVMSSEPIYDQNYFVGARNGNIITNYSMIKDR